jgi:hypothetical protein
MARAHARAILFFFRFVPILANILIILIMQATGLFFEIINPCGFGGISRGESGSSSIWPPPITSTSST